MERSIVCGVDGSNESRAALHVATQLADRLERRLVVAHVTQAPMFAPAYGSAPVVPMPTQEDIRAGEAFLDGLASDERLEDATLRPLFGFPA